MRRLLLLLLLSLPGCEGETTSTPPGDPSGQGDATGTGDVAEVPSFDPAVWHRHEAGPFTVPPGAERFFCYSHTLEEDLMVDEIVLKSRPVVHHVVFSQTRTPDPDGFFECDVLFQNNWVPILVAGTGDALLQMPEGAGHVLEKGTQLVAQLHLVNATLEEVTDTIPIYLRKMSEPPAHEVEVVVFGNTNIALPPGQTSEVAGTCTSDSHMTLFSAFAHMHLLGESMVVEAGPDPETLTEVFRRDPYDFDDQHLSPMDLTIEQGDSVRVTCGYDNTLDQTVTFGESTTDEMCFFIAFATGASHQLAGCLGGDSHSNDLIPETCGTDPPNDLGLGAVCTEGGGECQGGLLCTEDIEEVAGPQVCIGIGCDSSADCGEGGLCCFIEVADGATLCLPPSCLLSLCDVLP